MPELTFDEKAEWNERYFDLRKAETHVEPFTQEDADELDAHLAQAAARRRDRGRAAGSADGGQRHG